MSGLMVAPECPCGHRRTKIRFDTDDHVGVIRCSDCDERLMVVSVLANKTLTTIKDPKAGELPEGAYFALDEADRLPPAVAGNGGFSGGGDGGE